MGMGVGVRRGMSFYLACIVSMYHPFLPVQIRSF